LLPTGSAAISTTTANAWPDRPNTQCASGHTQAGIAINLIAVSAIDSRTGPRTP